jgi:signal transduction histidine kinase
MGSRGRSIRLRIAFLVAIPLITMLGLFAYVATTSVDNWLNLDRAPTLINETSEPLTNFVNVLQAERRAAVVYLSRPNAANLKTFQSAVNATKSDAVTVNAALTSPATKHASTPPETAAIDKVLAQINGMAGLRAQVTGKKLAPLDALQAYTSIIAGQGAVLQAEASSIQDSAPVIQGLGLISAVNTQEDVSEQDAVLASALVTGSLTPADRVAFSDAGGRLHGDTLSYQQLLTPAELATYNATMNKLAPQTVQDQLSQVQQAVPAGIPLSVMEQQGLSPQAWQLLTSTWLKAASKAGTNSATAVLAANAQPAIAAKKRVVVLGIVGAVGLILTLLVTILLGRSINRRLATLRRSALTLAEEQLPSVVARLRRGESVDVAAEAPPIRVGSDEIGQVGQAIDLVRQTAIRSAVEEARVRQGVNDMFRNLARRNQSLLQRQLTVLDEAERRATDPDVLEDLFKMDHLTTRMRRHAEGLIILSGAPPGRSWSAPVKLIDVMRGAVAEVEDYARVTVSTQSRAALSGSAVTDVIHLLAELIENATTLSPPFTQVRVGGETVAKGFAIEIEDRGLGMTPQKLQELNERLANPQDINPANTEQLGLFVVGQLARRHGINVMLRPSPYGGTTAVVLIPVALLVQEGPAAITAGGRVPAAGTAGVGGFRNGQASAYAAGPADDRAAWPGTGGWPTGTESNGWPTPAGAGSSGTGPSAAGPSAAGPSRTGSFGTGPFGTGPFGAGSAYGDVGQAPATAGYPSSGVPGSGGHEAGHEDQDRASIRISGVLRNPSPASGFGAPSGPGPAPGAAEPAARRGRHETDDVPVVTGVPVTRPVPPSTPPFDVFAPRRRSEPGSVPAADAPHPQSYPDFGGPAADNSPYGNRDGYAPAAAGYQEAASHLDAASPLEGTIYPASPSSAGDGAYGNDGGHGNHADSSASSPMDEGAGSTEFKGLPRRVRQASLAPQLRASAKAAAAANSQEAGVPRATAASLADMRSTLSAMQRGWQQGRSQTQPNTEGGADGN